MSKIKINTNIIKSTLDNDTKFIIVSDIHDDGLDKRVEKYKKLVDTISIFKPNYILVVGDTIESQNASIKNVENLVEDLGSIAPTILSIGNHERKSVEKGLPLDWFDNLERFPNVYPLNNSSITFNNIQFTGFEPSLEAYLSKNPNDIFVDDYQISKLTPSTKSKMNIMLVHNPEFINNETIKNAGLKNYDLFISGHTHNGCTPTFMEPLLKQKGIIGPYFKILPNTNVRGITYFDNQKLFVSKGFRKFTPEYKLFNYIDSLYPNDIHELILKKK